MGAVRNSSDRRKKFALTGKSLLYAIGIHVAIGIMLFVSFNFHSSNVLKPAAKPPVQPIQASAVTEAELQQQFDIIEERENRIKREKEQAEREVQELRKKQQQEAEKLAQIKKEQELQKKKAEEEAKAEVARKKKAEEEKKQAELARKKKEEEKRKAEIAKKKAEEEKKKKEELARKKKLEEEKRKKELALQQQLEQERQQQQFNSALNQYIPIIVQKVGRNWNQPGNLQRGITADVSVRLTAAGEVVSAQLTRSSGDSVFDRSVVNAVYKASPLPIPQERGVNERFRELTLKFNPEDLI